MSDNHLLEVAEGFVLKGDRSLQALARALAKEQGVPLKAAIQDIEASYVRAAEAEYGPEYEFWAQVKEDGTVQLAQVLKAVEVMRNAQREVAVDDLRRSRPDAQPGQYVVNTLDPIHPHKIAQWMRSTETQIENVKITSQ
ncbi:NusA N-terminal domain-containing protein [Ruegeria halocynthiae]|uniref:NusA N-terminal domain-containing protein n=1 Tax=Ruegeria halocynthiae TaxID=985054 RepID=A0A1H2R7Q7_9RHOB|nr:NusA N-terminal domain-containing protein [Ruegeria halocynthiae]SDW15513.1 NusA N-terminal domain-containing protein [Ruegeria halocynthiae]